MLFTVEIGTTARRRPYRQEARAASTAATRHGIVEAAPRAPSDRRTGRDVDLAVAAAADVQRLTVYRHFPTPETLDAACADREAVLHPPPDPAAFQAVDPVDRLLDALATFDRYYAEVDALLENLLRDAARHPPTALRVGAHQAVLDATVDRLAPGWTIDPARAPLVQAALGHALTFETWRSLRRDRGLTAEEASDLLVGLVEAAAEPLA